VIEGARASLAAHHKGYAPIAGQPAVRAAIAARIARRSGAPCATENVVVTLGAQAALYCVMQCVAGPGEEVIALDPVYATYGAVIAAAGAAMVKVPLDPARGFHPDLPAIEAAVTPATRAILINSPHNPTGVVFNESEKIALAEICRRHDLWLISDEVYEDMAYARPHVSVWSLPEAAGRAVAISSLSKSHAIPGFRLGWMAGPPELARHVFNLLLCMVFGGPPFIQEAVLPALLEDLPEVALLREDYRRRGEAMAALLNAAPGCRATPPEGGMFLLLDVRSTGLSALSFAEGLLHAQGVAVLPCDSFGDNVAGRLRISLTLPDEALLAAGRRIVDYAAGLRRSDAAADEARSAEVV
jgi:arginine:pyruvate transaminase